MGACCGPLQEMSRCLAGHSSASHSSCTLLTSSYGIVHGLARHKCTGWSRKGQHYEISQYFSMRFAGTLGSTHKSHSGQRLHAGTESCSIPDPDGGVQGAGHHEGPQQFSGGSFAKYMPSTLVSISVSPRECHGTGPPGRLPQPPTARCTCQALW